MDDHETRQGIAALRENPNQAARAFLRAHHTMTLATARDNFPWAASVYYVVWNADVYFFSNPNSRHMEDALRTGQAAAAISAAADDWKGIRGIQMTGRIREVRRTIEAAGVIGCYLKAFPFVRSFFQKDTEASDLTAFFTHFKARLYCFEPQCVYYLDNRIGFGCREKVCL